MSGPIAERSSLQLNPARPAQPTAMRQEAPGERLNLTLDQLSLSKIVAEAPKSEADVILEQVIRPAVEAGEQKRDVFAPAPIPPGPSKEAIAIQKIRFADMVRGGKESELDFERYPGDLTPRPQPPVFIDRDPRTGQPDLRLKELRARISGGDYDVYVKIEGDGSIGIDRIMKGGRNITSIAKDAVVEKIKEDPALYGTLAAVAVVGAVAAAHEYVKRTGDPIEFDALSHNFLKRDNFSVKGKLKAELTGDSSFVRASGAEVGAHYTTEKLDAFASAKYRVHHDEWEANLGANYKLDKNVNLTSGAFYRTKSKDYGAFVGLSAVF